MPRGDRTGPWGRGPRTGRMAGYCSGYDVPGYMNPIPGRGFRGRGRGFGRGRGRGFGGGWGRGRGFGYYDPYYPPPPYYPESEQIYQELPPEEEKTYLVNLAKSLEKELEEIKNRLKELTEKKK